MRRLLASAVVAVITAATLTGCSGNIPSLRKQIRVGVTSATVTSAGKKCTIKFGSVLSWQKATPESSSYEVKLQLVDFRDRKFQSATGMCPDGSTITIRANLYELWAGRSGSGSPFDTFARTYDSQHDSVKDLLERNAAAQYKLPGYDAEITLNERTKGSGVYPVRVMNTTSVSNANQSFGQWSICTIASSSRTYGGQLRLSFPVVGQFKNASLTQGRSALVVYRASKTTRGQDCPDGVMFLADDQQLKTVPVLNHYK